ncbi:putative sulfate exporter family transporter [Spelaeicoccus albus]|uniref:Putative membrane protein YadS n=1 Tax=Spelaeicoccus albus TaxID=1280376 RepID=A0A7Z0AAF8_9MICO|nr:putative sulfate exporter family transporter [Spelaeicoccus albus]NYI67399.1 putative membrane protein YadS [Spelaeicoccus albus]
MSQGSPVHGVFRRLAPGLVAAGAGAAVAYAVHSRAPGLPPLSVAIVLGLVLGNVTGFRQYANRSLRAGLDAAARYLLPAGLILSGLTVQITEAAAPPVPAAVAVAAVSFAAVFLIGLAFRLPAGEPLALAGGFALASGSFDTGGKKTRPSRTRSGDISVLATAGALIAVLLLPALTGALGLDAVSAGFWAGTGVPGAGQAIAAGAALGPGGQPATASAVSVAVLVRLFFAAVLAAVTGKYAAARLPAIAVVGFAVAVAVAAAGPVPRGAADVLGIVADVFVAAALIALGAAVKLSSLTRLRPRALTAGAAALVITAALAWAGAALL